MGRAIFAEESIEAKVQSFFGCQKLQVGLLIGQFTDARDYIIHMAKAPDPVENEAEIEKTEEEILLEGNDTEENRIIKKESKKESATSAKGTNEEDFDENWIIEHARQVHRMLAGGISVVVYGDDQGGRCGVLKGIPRSPPSCNAPFRPNPLCEQSCSEIMDLIRITCRSLDVRDSQSSLRPCEFKYQSFLHKWHSLRCVASVTLKVHVPSSIEKTNYESQIQASLQDYLEEIWNSITMINREIVGESDYLYAPAKGSKAKKEEPKTFDVELFSPCVSSSETMTSQKSVGVVTLRGQMTSRAYVHNKATKGMVAKAVKMDLVRSIQSRVGLLCEEAEINYLYQVGNWSLMSPTRIFAPMPKGPVHFCDYAFKDEKAKDSLDRFAELLNLDLLEGDLICSEKSPASDHPISSCSDETDTRSQTSCDSVEAAEKQTCLVRYFGWIMAVLILLLGVLITMFMSR